MRVGIGQAHYPADPKHVLMLGGVKIEGAWGLRGPGDGDVVLHAVVDALLGAGALGDREERFPEAAGPSAVEVAETLALLATSGLSPAHVDVSVRAARPALRDARDAMRDRLVSLLRVSPSQVSVKVPAADASDEGVAALAVVSLEENPA